MSSTKIKILVILGPTAVGKSGIAVELAKRFNGEVISADSRQVYRGLDIGTGKITREEMQGIPHHLIDVADPSETFTVKKWKALAERAIEDIHSRGKLPIICGGTGFYISSLIDEVEFPEIETDPEAHRTLEARSSEELFEQLKELDPDRAKTIDKNNKRRLARAILIARELGKVPPINKSDSKYGAVKIGIILPDEDMKQRIKDRLIKRIDLGMIDEAKRLHIQGLSLDRMRDLGLEYRYEAELLQGKLDREQLIATLATRIWQYARRQKTWFRKMKDVTWTSPEKAVEVAARIRN
jgi:tRNA dimethylallyltransferase